MPRANRTDRKRARSGAQIGLEDAIGEEVTGIDPAALDTGDKEEDLELDGLYVDDIPKESAAAPSAPSGRKNGKKKRKKKRAADRRREQEPEALAEPEGPETTTALPEPDTPGSELYVSQTGTGTGPSGRLSYAAGVLQCVKGPEEGLALNLIEGSYTIGRARENNFVLKDIAASREHLRIVVENNEVKAVDLGSGNGTKINGEKIGVVPLKNGDRIEIGNSVLVFTYLGRDRSVSLPAAPKSADDPPVERPPTQERIVMAAEKLAAELSERFRREDDGLDELPATSMERSLSNPRVPPSQESFQPQDSFVEDEDMAEAIQQMARDISSPSRPSLDEIVPEEEWADSETATRLPVGQEAAAARGYSGGLPSPQPGSSPSAAHTPEGVVAAPEPRRSSGVAMLLVSLVIVTLVGGGGIAAYLFVWPALEGGAVASEEPVAKEEAAGDEGEEGADAPAGEGEGEVAAASEEGDEGAKGDQQAAADDAAPSEERQRADDEERPSGTKVAKASDAKPSRAKEPDRADPSRRASERRAPSKAKQRRATKPKRRASPPPKKRSPPKKRAPRRPAPKKRAPDPEPAAADTLDDAVAKRLFVQAIKFLKKSDTKNACRYLGEVKQRAAKGSIWRMKAVQRHDRDCR